MKSFLWVACTVVLACSSSTTTTGGTAQDKGTFVKEYCSLLAPCCQQQGLSGSTAQCEALFSGLASGNYDVTRGNACLAEMRSASNVCANGPSTEVAPSCDKAFVSNGVVKPGEACTNDTDCAPSAEGDVDCSSWSTDGSIKRLCQVRVKGKEGDTPCVGTVEGSVTSSSNSSGTTPPAKGYLCYLKEGLACASSGKCERVANVGEACKSSSGCAESAYCDFGTSKCTAKKAAGEACTGAGDCQDELSCDQTTKTCKAGLPAGAACVKSDECKSRSCVNAKCAPDFVWRLVCST